MYNTLATCTYHKDDIFLETDDVTPEEKDYVRNVIYLQELMDIFELEEYDETLLQSRFHNLAELMQSYDPFRCCIVTACDKIQTNDVEMGWVILFAYDYLHYTHACVSEYLTTGSICDENIEKLRNALAM